MIGLNEVSSINQLVEVYLRNGYNHAKIIESLLREFFTNKSDLKLFDFAYGHGRISRYLKHLPQLYSLHIAEIKPNAVLFQKERFGLHGFLVSHHPKDFVHSEKYDFILASSLFTHLNYDLFVLWLEKITTCLLPGGIFAFSVHLLEEDSDIDFKYLEVSEENVFPDHPDSLAKAKVYGSTYLTEAKLIQILSDTLGGTYSIVDKRTWIKNTQEIFCVRKYI